MKNELTNLEKAKKQADDFWRNLSAKEKVELAKAVLAAPHQMYKYMATEGICKNDTN